jgi:hypothetical protein
MPHWINQHDAPADTSPKAVYLTDAQFEKIVELLTPGYKLSMLYLEQLAQKPAEPVAPLHPPFDE